MICTICLSLKHRASKCSERNTAAAFGVVLLSLMLGGCPADRPVPYQPVNIVGDTYCSGTKARTWSVDDTQQTIDDARRFNAARQAKCEAKKK